MQEIEQFEQKLLNMIEHAERAGITPQAIEQLIHKARNWNQETLTSALTELTSVEQTAYQRIVDVWTQPNVTPEHWENYKLFFGGKAVLEEQKQLKEAQKEFRQSFRAFKEKLRATIEKENSTARKENSE